MPWIAAAILIVGAASLWQTRHEVHYVSGGSVVVHHRYSGRVETCGFLAPSPSPDSRAFCLDLYPGIPAFQK